MADRIIGAFLLVNVALVFLDAACTSILRHPTWYGVLLTGAAIYAGFLVCASVARDRLS